MPVSSKGLDPIFISGLTQSLASATVLTLYLQQELQGPNCLTHIVKRSQASVCFPDRTIGDHGLYRSPMIDLRVQT